MKALNQFRSALWLPGIYNLPRLLSLSTLLVALFSIFFHFAYPETRATATFRMLPTIALTFLLLALSLRLARWERVSPRSARRAKLSRLLAAFAALLTFSFNDAPILLAAGLSMLSAILILQANGSLHFARRVLLTVSLIIATWLVIANLYDVRLGLNPEFTSDPTSAVLLLALTLSISLAETRNGLIPVSFAISLGERGSVRLLLAALLIPLMMGYIRLELAKYLDWSANLMEALHVMATLCVMAALLLDSLRQASVRIEDQRRTRADLEASERAYEALLEQGSEFFVTLNLAGRLTHANESARRYLGLGDLRKSVVCLEDILADESRDQVRQLPDALLRGVSNNAVLLFRLADGEAMPLYVTAACRLRDGAAVEIVLIGRSLPLGLRPENTSQALLAPS